MSGEAEPHRSVPQGHGHPKTTNRGSRVHHQPRQHRGMPAGELRRQASQHRVGDQRGPHDVEAFEQGAYPLGERVEADSGERR